MKRAICLFSFILLTSAVSLADIPRPRAASPTPKPKAVDAEMTIRLDRTATEARLLIPRAQLKQLRAELEGLDLDDNDTAAVGTLRTQTMIGGLFLSLAFVFGGIWFVRSGKVSPGTARTLVVLAALGGIGSAATFVYANAGPPSAARSITGKMFSQSVHLYKFGYGRVKLELKGEGDGNGIELIVPDAKPDASPVPGEE